MFKACIGSAVNEFIHIIIDQIGFVDANNGLHMSDGVSSLIVAAPVLQLHPPVLQLHPLCAGPPRASPSVALKPYCLLLDLLLPEPNYSSGAVLPDDRESSDMKK